MHLAPQCHLPASVTALLTPSFLSVCLLTPSSPLISHPEPSFGPQRPVGHEMRLSTVKTSHKRLFVFKMYKPGLVSNILTPLGYDVPVASINFLVPLLYYVEEGITTRIPSQVSDKSASLFVATDTESFSIIHLVLPVCYGCCRLKSTHCP